MKSILISIKPKYVAKILNGEKTIEIRKTMPKCDLPIDVYIYCTSHKNYRESLYKVYRGGYDVDYYDPCVSKAEEKDYLLNGMVVAKFTLNKVKEIRSLMCGDFYHKDICLTTHELNDYLGHKGYGYAWHISNLVIFDKPKELSEFDRCILTEDLSHDNIIHIHQRFETTKAPQSWCYIESEK